MAALSPARPAPTMVMSSGDLDSLHSAIAVDSESVAQLLESVNKSCVVAVVSITCKIDRMGLGAT
jgi:hypothetical protein